MKKLYLFILVNFCAIQIMYAQSQPSLSTQYYFKTKTNVELENMADATTLLGAIRADDQASAETPLSFPFQFVSHTFTSFQVFSSGALVLLPNASASLGYQVLLPWSESGFFTGDDGHISYKIVGTTNRKLVIEYYLADFIASTSFAAIADKKFQIWLYENSNQIQFVYSDGRVGKYNPVVGISGSEAQADLLQVNTETHQITNDASYVSSTWPGNGRSYVFSPTSFLSVDPQVSITNLSPTSVCEGSSVVLTAQLSDAAATGYQWQKDGLTIDGATGSNYNAIATGKYTVQISYDGGTITSSYINVFVAALQANVVTTNITCNANTNGSITIANAAGGNNLYEYSLNNGPLQSSEVFSGLAAGSYSVQLHSGGCSKSLGSYIISDTRVSPVVSILQSSGGACANVTLTANPADALSYKWSNGSTSKSITLDNGAADGKYTLTVSNGVGCIGYSNYTYNKENQLNSYVIIASKAVSLGENNTVNGAVGNSGSLPVYINKNSTVNAFIRAVTVKLNEPVSVSGLITKQAPQLALPNVYTNTSVSNKLASFEVPDNFSGTVAGNYNKLVIGKKAKVTLSGTIFGKITVKEGAQVNFSAGDISIDNIDAADGNKNTSSANFTSLTFSPGTIIRIKEKIVIGKRNKINAGGSTFYLADLSNDVEKAVIDGVNTEFNGNIYAPGGKISVRNGELAAPCIMNGIFICENIISEQYVTWNRNVCNQFAPRAAVASTIYTSKVISMSVYPNPASSKFNLVLKTPVITNAEISVIDINGTVIKKEVYSNVTSGKALPINLTNQPAGAYLLKVTTKLGTQTLKVVVK